MGIGLERYERHVALGCFNQAQPKEEVTKVLDDILKALRDAKMTAYQYEQSLLAQGRDEAAKIYRTKYVQLDQLIGDVARGGYEHPPAWLLTGSKSKPEDHRIYLQPEVFHRPTKFKPEEISPNTDVYMATDCDWRFERYEQQIKSQFEGK